MSSILPMTLLRWWSWTSPSWAIRHRGADHDIAAAQVEIRTRVVSDGGTARLIERAIAWGSSRRR